MFVVFFAIWSLPFERAGLMALFEASRHSNCADPAHFGHPANPFRTIVRRGRKLSDNSPDCCPKWIGSASGLNRTGVRNGSDYCPVKIGLLSEMRRNTQLGTFVVLHLCCGHNGDV